MYNSFNDYNDGIFYAQDPDVKNEIYDGDDNPGNMLQLLIQQLFFRIPMNIPGIPCVLVGLSFRLATKV